MLSFEFSFLYGNRILPYFENIVNRQVTKVYFKRKINLGCGGGMPSKTKGDKDMDKYKSVLSSVLNYLPGGISRELSGIIAGSHLSIREIRLRKDGVSGIVTNAGSFPLLSRVDGEAIEAVVNRLCRGSVYAFLDSINAGYIPLSHGVRVGIVGEAKYDAGRLVGVSGISALNFRIPTLIGDFCGELYREWLSTPMENLLILAPPCGGKTTALRSLAHCIGTGREAKKVVVVDERFEFDPSDYRGSTVDILQGYRRGLGTEVAVRTMSPEVILVDEIATPDDAQALRLAIGVGIPVIATAHGTDPKSLTAREHLTSLLRDGCFSRFCNIQRLDGGFSVSKAERIAI